MSWRRFEGRNPYGSATFYHSQARGPGPGRGRGRAGKGRGRGPGRHSQAKSEGHINEVTKRLLSANHLRMKELQNQLTDMQKQLKMVKDENRLFKQVQYKQERALRKFEDTESQLPQLIQAHNNEVRSLREQLRHAREKYDKTDRYLRDAEDELEKANSQMKKFKTLSEQKNLGERSELSIRLNKAEASLEEKNDRLTELERHVDMVKKNHRHEMGIERARAKEALRQIEDIKEEKAKLEILVKEKERQLEAKNIYSNRLLMPSSHEGTPAHTPPLWKQNLNKKSGSLSDLNTRGRAKAYEDKRKAGAAGKKLHLPKLPTSPHKVMEKHAKSQEPKPKVVEEEKEKDTTAENKTIHREDSETEFWRRQEERYKLDQINRDKQDEDRKRKEQDEARLREEHEKMKRDLEERARVDRERREAEEREQRERERKEEVERKEREREQNEREERERKEAEQREVEKREEELRAREEQERLATEERLAEERRKKEELLRRLQHMDGAGNPSQPSADPFAPPDRTRQRGGDPFAPSPSKRKDYTFTPSVENLHKGKPSHETVSNSVVDRQKRLRAGDDSDIGGYQPSFTGPIKSTGMKQKKPMSLFNDDEAKPAMNSAADGADKKSKLMANLFGSQAASDSDKNGGGDDLFLGNRPAPRQPVQNKRAGVFPWDEPAPPVNKQRETERRESNALFGGGAAVVDDNDESLGHTSASAKSSLLPRRPRQSSTTFSSKPAVLAVDNFDDDIEEVVL